MITKLYRVHGAVNAPVITKAIVDGEEVLLSKRRITAELVPVDADGSGTLKVVCPVSDEAAELFRSGGEVLITIAPAPAKEG